MIDLSIIILTYNEELHIRRALDNVCSFAQNVYVVDCFSIDRTRHICSEFDNVQVIEHAWPGNQAEQFNWALENLPISTKWVFRLDADEYITSELKKEIEERLPTLPDDVSAVITPLGRSFRGRLLKHGIVNGVKMIRLFRYGKVRYEQRLMDEHLEILNGKTISFEHQFVDDNLLPIGKFIDKHNNYSSREAAILLDAEFGLTQLPEDDGTGYAKDVAKKRVQKAKYAKMPLYWRALGYFIYRYIFKLGFLDGIQGFEWDFFQGLWYRMLIDAKINEIKKKSSGDKDKIRQLLKDDYNISL